MDCTWNDYIPLQDPKYAFGTRYCSSAHLPIHDAKVGGTVHGVRHAVGHPGSSADEDARREQQYLPAFFFFFSFGPKMDIGFGRSVIAG